MKILIAAILVVAVNFCHGVTLVLKPYNETAYGMFMGVDTDMDGVLTLAELDSSFDKYDANGDGTETRHEYTEFLCATSPMLYQLSHYLYDEYDSNGDHHLRKEDYDALFGKMDKDGDGMVSDMEFIDYWVAIFPKYEQSGPHSQTHLHGNSACH